MKAFSITLEFRLLKTICSKENQKTSARLLSNIDESCFNSASAKEIYRRVSSIVQKRSVILSWDDLGYDPALSEKTREKILTYKRKPYPTKERSMKALSLLHDYRRIRALYFTAEQIFDKLKQNRIDIDQAIEEASTSITNARSTLESDTWFTNFGVKNDSSGRKLVDEVLKSTRNRFIPTGIKAFDQENIGFILGSFVLLAATTGGGKSIMAGQLAENMALAGARVCVVPLEMDEIENAQRQVSRQSNIPIQQILNPSRLSRRDKKRIKRRMLEFEQKIAKNHGSLTYYIPEEDIDINNLLMTLKPYKYDVILIDYLGLLKGVDGDDQAKALSRVTRISKRFAVANKNIVVGLAQLSKEGVVRYSRAMEEHANMAWYWTRDDEAKETEMVEIEMPKSRNQKSFNFLLGTDFEHMRFKDLSEAELRRVEKKVQEDAEKGKKGVFDNDNDEEHERDRKGKKGSRHGRDTGNSKENRRRGKSSSSQTDKEKRRKRSRDSYNERYESLKRNPYFKAA